jgi:GNAT superfamily N-acetyltransferase
MRVRSSPNPVSDALAVRRVRMGESSRLRSIRLEALRDPAAHVAFLEKREEAEARPDEFWRERAAQVALSESAAQFVAEAGRDFVGTVTVLVPEADAVDYFGRRAVTGRALVVAVYIRPSHRGEGIIEALMDAAAEWAGGVGARELALDVHQDNARAARAYARCGFVATGRVSDGPNGTELEMVRGL